MAEQGGVFETVVVEVEPMIGFAIELNAMKLKEMEEEVRRNYEFEEAVKLTQSGKVDE